MILNGQAPDTTEPQYVGGIGPNGIACLEDFVRGGGTLVCIDESCNLPIEHLNIPVRNIVQGKKQGEFFCPGSILRIRVEREHPVGYGMEESVSGYFIVSQAFDIIKPEDKKEDPRSPAQRFPVTVVARYSDTALLESGVITGGGIIADKPAIVEVQYGKGHIVLLGFRVQHRAQTPGTFRFLFNAIQRSTFNQ